MLRPLVIRRPWIRTGGQTMMTCTRIRILSHVDAVATGPRGCISVLNGRPRRRRTCPIVGIATVCCDVEVADATVKWIVKKRLAGAGNLNSTRAGLQRGAA